MGIVGKLVCSAGIIAFGYIGYRSGNGMQQDREYVIIAGNQPAITSVSLNRSHRLVNYDNEAFMGTLDHCLSGTRQLAFYEGFTSAQPSKPGEQTVPQSTPESKSTLQNARQEIGKKIDELSNFIREKYRKLTQ